MHPTSATPAAVGPPLFEIEGNTYIALDAAAGPWSPDHCHGGAVAALFGHASSAIPVRAPMAVARLSCDFHSAVPTNVPLTIEASIEKDGRKMQLSSFRLSAGPMVVARATVLKIRTELEPAKEALAFAPDPSWPRAHVHGGFAEQFEMVSERGGFGQIGPGRLWFRLRSLFATRQVASPLVRALASADFANGFAMDLPFAEWAFPTLDLSVHLSREPAGEWIVVDAECLGGAPGRAQCLARLEDQAGLFGHSSQSVFIEPREK